ncbi:MAG TPA: ABC transporter ATP-binding protein, partial [Candidatus Sulfotelmatobacter sp.]|nr:ABC transporter ATP-binding protein [Candidatus Sulfotelmatobacter sp.]
MTTQNANSVIVLNHVSRHYGAKFALNDVSLEVPRGGVLGLVGANGAGKTTLIKHMLGLLRAQTGSVRVFGLDPVAHAVGVLGRLGYLSEDRDLPPWISVGELLRYSRAFYPGWDAAYAETLRDQFQLSPTSRIRTLSKGELAKAGLLVALAHRPELLVLDEPSSGLDPIVRREMLEAIVRAVAEEGRTVLFSSHLLDEIARVSDRVAMLAQGRLVLQGELHEVLDTHRRIVVRLPGAPQHSLPGVLSLTGGPEEWTAICNGAGEQFAQAVRQCRGEVLEESGATLEEIFHARVSEARNAEAVARIPAGTG